jgi:hypothetical protein
MTDGSKNGSCRPSELSLRRNSTDGAFLFPQITLDQQANGEMGEQCWSPGFVDYLFSPSVLIPTMLLTSAVAIGNLDITDSTG